MVDIQGMSILTWIVSIVVLLVTTLYLVSKKKHKYWANRGVPHIKPLPFIGNSLFASLGRKNLPEMMLDVYNDLSGHQFGGVMEIWDPCLYIRDPELIKKVMIKDFDHFVDHLKIETINGSQYFSNMLSQLDGKQWKDVRSVMTPSFTGGKMKKMVPLMMECCDQLILLIERENIKGKQPLDGRDLYSRFTLDVIATIAFGIEGNSLKDKDASFAKMAAKMHQISKWQIVTFILYALSPKLSKVLGISPFESEPIRFFVDAVKSTIEYREKHSIKRNDFLQLMLNARTNEGRGTADEGQDQATNDGFTNDTQLIHKVTGKKVLSDDMVVSQCLLFLFAGFDTISNTLQFASYHLAANPDIQQKLYDHIEEVVAEHDGLKDYDTIHHMPYLDMVISETLRLHPALPRIDRKCTERYEIPDSDVVLEKDRLVFISVTGLHMDKQYFPDPEKFDPERFTPENKAARSPYVYHPFGHGPRNCIGNRFALMELNLVLVCLLRQYVIKTAPKMIVPMVPDQKSFVFRAKGGVWLEFEPRK